MTKLTAVKEISDFDSSMLADSTGIDVVTIHMVEHGIVPAHYDIADAMCEAMDVGMKDMFPSLAEIFSLADALDSEAEVQELFFDPANKMAIRSAGLDPDLRDWIMVVDLRSVNERRYRLSSMEMEKIKNELVSAKDANGFICFYSDCQQVIIRKSAISEVSFRVGASYAQFSSRERAYAATMIFEGSSRPEVVGLHPDGGDDGEGEHPFANLLDAALNGRDLPPFFMVETEDDTEERFVSIHGLEVLEIPMGVLFPEIYAKDSDARYVGPDSGLGGMDAQGSA
ncbi:hypothetical protein OIU34_18155 [Pararhizobium sp. BT-229]|uniref:hypothetical protein n=1 Tax=Pararhizobium sp. BT-229 TaxID=2986923 RepID=UPI0021F72FFE|nr:hypothetical protein [Pararhizobium sp. BT-229]MCV9963803.1 hypothetical protein [Pararhizobium sp. BT-229]